MAAPLHLEMDGDVTRGWVVYGPAHEGSPGDLHGGVAIAAFDDLLGCAQMVGTTTGRTGTLTVRFWAAHPVGRRIDYEVRLDRVEGRKVFCSGEARCDGTLLAEAEAIFVAPAAPPTTDTHDTHLEV
jgi:acyl-coenzyme A thioesterase PaaI-like protein